TPSPMNVTSWTKNRNTATATAISGVTNEKSIRKFALFPVRPCHRSSATANATPNGTAMTATSTPSRSVLNRAVRSEGSCHTELTSPTNHLVENPCQAEIDRPLLNENSTAIATGTSVQAR